MTVSAYIFAGPTLPLSLIREHGYDIAGDELVLPNGQKIKVLPPVSEGDIYQLSFLKPKVVGIIDGYFENVPSVWHKEILHAMSQGIHILGASSMGALRAAELRAFGMEGVGEIFQAFADGFLNDDDEVTVVHGPAELGFPALSEAMVNIRKTLEAACRDGIISISACEALLFIAKGLHYKSRNYGRVIAGAGEQGIDKGLLENFAQWLPTGRRDQKQIDALALLEAVIEKVESGIEPKKPLFHFENTVVWEQVRTQPNQKLLKSA